VIVIALRAVMMIMMVMMVMMPPTVTVMTIIADIYAGSPRMSALGQKRKSSCVNGMSVLPPRTDLVRLPRHVSNVPTADLTGEQSLGVLSVYPLPIGCCDDQKPHSLGHDGLRVVT
jgi:hypothetical protein